MPFFTTHRCLVVVVVDEAAAVDQVGPASSGRQPGGPRLFFFVSSLPKRLLARVPYTALDGMMTFVGISFFSFFFLLQNHDVKTPPATYS
jgi:hypothetical protein